MAQATQPRRNIPVGTVVLCPHCKGEHVTRGPKHCREPWLFVDCPVAGVQFAGVWLQSDPDVLRQRVAARTGDASDADVAVLEKQLAAAPPPPADWTLVTDHDFDSEARKLIELLA